jgi:protein-tyrosine phosphatase
MGNICRSPTAEGVFRRLVSERAPDLDVAIDSAGTHGYHVGEPPDPRSIEAAARRGVDLRALRARKVEVADFVCHDLVIAMDRLNRETLIDRCPPEYHSRVRLFLEFAPGVDEEDVPDPYYGGPAGFERVLDLAEEASMGLLDELLSRTVERR